MKKLFGKIVGFFHSHHGIKTSVVGLGGLAITSAANGAFGPQAAVIAGAVTAVLGLFIKRPQDGAGATPAAPDAPTPPAIVTK